jgi:hypothetical protein
MPKRDDILDRPVLALSESDFINGRSLCEGCFVAGAPGSGKTTTSGKQLAYGLLRVPNSGGLVLTAKAEETLNWIRYAKACGREKDLIIFNAESGHCFDPLHYEWTRPGRGAGDLESVIDFFSTLVSIGKKEVGHGHDPFWERGNEQLMRNVIKIIDLAGEPIPITTIDRVIKSLPTHPEEYEQEQWQRESFCARLISSIKERKETLTPDMWSDLDFATQFIFRKWPAFDERPRSSLEMTWSGMADKFLFSPLNRLFCSGKCTFTPEMTMNDGKWIVCDFPLLEYGHETGRLCNIMLKLIFQRAWLRRNVQESPNLCCLWEDEMQYFITRRDNFFQQTCRGSRVAVVCLTQNILNISEELGEHQPGSKTKSFLGNLGIKIFHQQNDVETCKYGADQIGQEYRYLDNYHASAGNDHTNASFGASKQLVHLLEPIEFTRLLKPDGDNPYAEAIVYKGGQVFKASVNERNPEGSNYLRVFFTRET